MEYSIMVTITFYKLLMRLFIISLFLILHNVTLGQMLKGQIMNGKNSKPISWGTLILHSKDGKKEVGMADLNGNFSFPEIDTSNIIEITFSAPGYQDTTFKNISVKGNTTITLVYFNYCQYDASLKNKICPTCKAKDAVIPILYGLPIAQNGKAPAKDNGKKYILAGCEITGCDPHWYCKRDKIRF
jgi:hypothetical protein